MLKLMGVVLLGEMNKTLLNILMTVKEEEMWESGDSHSFISSDCHVRSNSDSAYVSCCTGTIELRTRWI